METILEEDSKAIKSRFPITNGHRPFLRNIPHCQINQLESSLIRGENLLGLNHFSQTAIHWLNCLDGINRSTHLKWERKEADNVRPMTTPRLANWWILLVQFLSKEFKVKLCLRFRCRRINRLEVSTNLLTLLPRHKSGWVTHHMNNT